MVYFILCYPLKDLRNKITTFNIESEYQKDNTAFLPLNKIKPCSSAFLFGWVTQFKYPCWNIASVFSFFLFFVCSLSKAILATVELPGLCNVLFLIVPYFVHIILPPMSLSIFILFKSFCHVHIHLWSIKKYKLTAYRLPFPELSSICGVLAGILLKKITKGF